MAASACLSCNAAARLANVSGKLVPKAMNVIPLTLSSKLREQPSSTAICRDRGRERDRDGERKREKERDRVREKDWIREMAIEKDRESN